MVFFKRCKGPCSGYAPWSGTGIYRCWEVHQTFGSGLKNTVSTGFPEKDRSGSKKRVTSIVHHLQGKDQNRNCSSHLRTLGLLINYPLSKQHQTVSFFPQDITLFDQNSNIHGYVWNSVFQSGVCVIWREISLYYPARYTQIEPGLRHVTDPGKDEDTQSITLFKKPDRVRIILVYLLKGYVGRRENLPFSNDFRIFIIILWIFNQSGKLIMLLYPFSSTGADGI